MKKLTDLLFPGKAKDNQAATSLQTVAEYAPVFSPFSGGIYDQTLTRRAIEAFAQNFSKLQPVVMGSAQPRIRRAFKTAPNNYMTWPKFLARVATLYECDATVAIVPEFGNDLETFTGLWPLRFSTAEIKVFGDEPWVRFTLPTGEVMAIELKNVCFLTKYQYLSDFFSEPNVLESTMELMHAQEQAQTYAVRNGAVIRFIAAVDGMMDKKLVEEKRKEFSEANLSAKNKSGLMVYDGTFRDLKEVSPRAFTIDSQDMERIVDGVCTYFGTNKKILQNDYDEETWDAYYEGKIEPLALQLGTGLTMLLYTQGERLHNEIMFSANRLEYASAASKRNLIRDMVDRGVISRNEGRQILQLPPIEGGDQIVVRGEYVDASLLRERTIGKLADAAKESDTDPGDTDDDYMGKDKEEGDTGNAS